MSQFKTQIVSVDKSFYHGQTPPSSYETAIVNGIEGREAVVAYYDQTAPTGNQTESPGAGFGPTIRLVRNVHATTCAAGNVVKPGATGHYASRTAGQASTLNESALGVVHHRLLLGIPQHDIGAIVVYGPVWVNKVAGALSAGDKVVVSATAGSVQAFADTDTDDTTATVVDEAHAIVGKVLRDAASGDAQVEIFVGRV